MDLPPTEIMVIWGMAGFAALITFILYKVKQRRKRRMNKNEEIGGDVVTAEEPKKKGKGLKIKFGKGKKEELKEEPQPEVKPDEVIEPYKEPEEELHKLSAMEYLRELNNNLLSIQNEIKVVLDSIGPAETPEQKEIRELKEKLDSLEKRG